jgi:hypothetical protein
MRWSALGSCVIDTIRGISFPLPAEGSYLITFYPQQSKNTGRRSRRSGALYQSCSRGPNLSVSCSFLSKNGHADALCVRQDGCLQQPSLLINMIRDDHDTKEGLGIFKGSWRMFTHRNTLASASWLLLIQPLSVFFSVGACQRGKCCPARITTHFTEVSLLYKASSASEILRGMVLRSNPTIPGAAPRMA